MIESIQIQVQSVLYKNEVTALQKTLENLANAVCQSKKAGLPLETVVYRHGDASPEPLFTQETYTALCAPFTEALNCSYVFFDENTGHSRGQNKLVKNCRSDYILILNPDIVVNPLLFTQLLSPFMGVDGDRVGITEARQTPLEHAKEYDVRTGETSWCTGACLLTPTQLFQDLGGFDADNFYMYCDDVDYSWRVRLAGKKTLYVPDAPVFHAKRLSADASWQPTEAEKYYSAEAALLMAHKWSAPDRLEEILGYFKTCSPTSPEGRAATAYLERKQEGRLPVPLDPEHKIALFTNQGYGHYRFAV